MAVGPLRPELPVPRFPLGDVLAPVLLPVVASVVGLRIAQQLNKVARASDALGAGALDARVDNTGGHSHELTASTTGGFCSVEGRTKGTCAGMYVCCHDCAAAAAPLLPFKSFACFPAGQTPLLTGMAK